MNALRSMSKKKLALILAAVFLVSGLITTYFVFASLVPRALDQLAFEQGRGDPSAISGNWQEYYQNWTVEGQDGDSISVDLDAVFVEFVLYDGSTVNLRFSGQVYPSRDGSVPEINVQEDETGVKVNTGRQRSWIDTSTDNLRGTLRIEVPKTASMHLQADLFSGGITLKGCQAESLSLSSSSGNILVKDTMVTGDLYCNSFSGQVQIKDTVTQSACTVETSSGKVEAEGLGAKFLTLESFSGNVVLEELDVTGAIKVDSSSGQITLKEFRARELYIDGFSGNVELKAGTIAGDVMVDVSSANVKVEKLTAGLCNVSTFSGEVELEELAVSTLKTDTSSGDMRAELTKGADLDCGSLSGGISLEMPGDYAFTAEIDTLSGSVDVAYPLLVKFGDNSSSTIRGEVGAGTYQVFIGTSSGDIKLFPSEED